MVVLDEAGEVIRPAKLWNDTESAPDAGWLIKQLPAGAAAWAAARNPATSRRLRSRGRRRAVRNLHDLEDKVKAEVEGRTGRPFGLVQPVSSQAAM